MRAQRAQRRICDAVAAVTPVETGIARRLALLDATEERLEGAVYPLYHVLHHLRSDFTIVRHGLLDAARVRLPSSAGSR
jgi:hypothetical protein